MPTRTVFTLRRHDEQVQTPRLVASDVDGTLYAPGYTVTQRTRDTVARVVASGVPFVLVTGRPPVWVTPVVEAIGFAGMVACANGAVIYDAASQRVLHADTLDPIQLHDVAHALYEAMPGCAVAVERLTTTKGQAFFAEPGYVHAWTDGESARTPRAEVLGHPAVKLLVRHEHMTSAQMSESASAVLGDAVTITYSSGDGLLEIAVSGVTKATGLATIADGFGLDAQGIIAFGDMPNDIPMLTWVEHGVAMANAHPDVLHIADEVTAANTEDGVARILERWF